MLRFAVPGLIVTISFVVVLIVVGGVDVLHADDYVDPFAEYNALMPGQPATAIAGFACSKLYHHAYEYDPITYCQIRPKDGPIVLISVSSREDKIQRISFSMNGMEFGDLVMRWGRPNDIKLSKRYYFGIWKDGIYATAGKNGWFTYRSSVTTLSMAVSLPKAKHEM
jgi:hypothetical protein